MIGKVRKSRKMVLWFYGAVKIRQASRVEITKNKVRNRRCPS